MLPLRPDQRTSFPHLFAPNNSYIKYLFKIVIDYVLSLKINEACGFHFVEEIALI